MPEWLQPSGEFGIGFQSIFMITDLVHINTKSFFTQQELEIELSNPKIVFITIEQPKLIRNIRV